MTTVRSCDRRAAHCADSHSLRRRSTAEQGDTREMREAHTDEALAQHSRLISIIVAMLQSLAPPVPNAHRPSAVERRAPNPATRTRPQHILRPALRPPAIDARQTQCWRIGATASRLSSSAWGIGEAESSGDVNSIRHGGHGSSPPQWLRRHVCVCVAIPPAHNDGQQSPIHADLGLLLAARALCQAFCSSQPMKRPITRCKPRPPVQQMHRVPSVWPV